MIYIAFTILLIYALLILSFYIGFDKIKEFKINPNLIPKSTFSIIIPFRNEENNIPILLNSISKLNYPKKLYEIILVNDFSDDESVNILKAFISKNDSNITILKNSNNTNSPKKNAIHTAIKSSNFKWILTTDADCVLPNNWLLVFDNFIQQNDTNMIVGPVTYNITNRFLEKFQLLDFLSLIGATIGSFGINKPFLSNGANLCYQKNLFYEVMGFEGNSSIASGDDIFLLEKFLKKDASKVHYLKSIDGLVFTKPQQSFKELIQQRKRWAAKTTNYNNWFGKFVGLIVFTSNLVLVLLLILALLNKVSFIIVGILFLIKFNVDFLLLFKTSEYFNQQNILISYLFSSLVYPFFSVFIVILSFQTNYKWKGRTFKK